MAEFLLWLQRFRTWVFNILAAVVIVIPDILAALAGNDWSAIVPREYMPYVTAGIVIVNVLLRPRPASTAAERKKAVEQ